MLCAALSGCHIPRSEVLIPVLTSVAPPMVGMLTADDEVKGGGFAEFGLIHTLDEEPLAGGWAVGTRGAFIAPGEVGFAMFGRFEAGSNNEDFYGIAATQIGAGFRLDPSLTVAGLFGYTYGGVPQNGHTFPLRLLVSAQWRRALGVQGSFYVGWRKWVGEHYPAAEDSVGIGWNTYGGDLAVRIGSGTGVALGVNVDRQDDITIVGLRLSLNMYGGQ